jgi:hypothetical protein
MRSFQIFLLLLTLSTIVSFCKKNKNSSGCSPDASTVRQITNKQATIKVTATYTYPVYIIEQGSVDTKLVPCNFPMEFYQNDLQVVISGDVKYTIRKDSDPCCIENFVITKITK